jgi:hypothetical protein
LCCDDAIEKSLLVVSSLGSEKISSIMSADETNRPKLKNELDELDMCDSETALEYTTRHGQSCSFTNNAREEIDEFSSSSSTSQLTRIEPFHGPVHTSREV